MSEFPIASPITSSQNPKLKSLAKLREKRGRKQQQRFIIDGFREIERAIESGCEIEEVYFAPDRLTEAQSSRMLSWSEQRTLSAFELPSKLMDRFGYGERNAGILATAKVWERSLESLKLPTQPLLVIVENVEKPGNLGAILRTASAAAVDAVITCGQSTDLFNANTIRSSTGAVFTVPCLHADTKELLDWLQNSKLDVFSFRLEAKNDFYACDLTRGCAVVLGNEAEGLSELWNDTWIQAVEIPMQGKVDSLNLSVTAAVAVFEAQRQRAQVEKRK